MPIKTLHVTNAYHATSGGISTFYRAMLNAANRKGRQMRLVVPGDQTKVESIGDFGIIYHIKAPRTPIFDRRYRLLLPTTYLLNGALSRILRSESPDLVEVCDKYAVSWLGGILRERIIPGVRRPVLVGMSCERMDDNVRAFVTNSRFAKRWTRFYLGNMYMPLFDYHIANSEYTADELRAALVSRHKRDIHVRPMGADVADYASAQRSDAGRRNLLSLCNGERETRALLYAGRLSYEKNIALLIDMMELLVGDSTTDYRLIIAGDGPLADWFEAEARRRAPGRIFSLGHIGNRALLVDLYANCDVFVHPNPREPFGIAPLEAMAAGLPLVAPRSGGVLSYANESNSWLAEPAGEAFATAVRSVFSDDDARREKVARALATTQLYTWESVTAQFFDLYDELHADFPATR
ncbi:MAG: glycosyltransferase, partial [Blastocatellia bacterium]|nr:glycosyltransferase [Blastocatellia bacterium]